MPLPLIPVAIFAAAAAAVCIKKGYNATKNFKNVKKYIEDGNTIISTNKATLNQHKDALNSSLTEYGRLKLDVLSNEINDFVTYFQQIKNIEIIESEELNNLRLGKFSNAQLKDLIHNTEIAIELSKGLAAGAVGGGLTALGAYSGTMTLAAASTGTAISTLSGAAATNATLAWIGGGTLAAGGFGVAGGMMVLGGIVAAPTILISGVIMEAKSKTKLNEAKTHYEEAVKYEKDVEIYIQQMNQISDVINIAKEILSKTQNTLRIEIDEMCNIFNAYGYDYKSYPQNAQDTIIKALKYAQLVKAIIDTPILDADGNLVTSKEYFRKFDI